MRRNSKQNTIGSLPLDRETCAILRDKRGRMICESYVYRIGLFRFNWHPSLEIMFVLAGQLRLFTEQRPFLLREGDFIVIHPNEAHASLAEAPGTIAAVMHISQKYIEEIFPSSLHFDCVYDNSREHDASYYRIRNAFASFYRLASSEMDAGQRIYAESELLAVIGILIMKFASRSAAPNSGSLTWQQNQKMGEILQQIEKNYRHEYTLKTLAESVDMNPSYLSSFFKKHMMMGFHEYLTRKRLALAVFELNTSDNTILETAINSGFPDAKGLYAAFHRYFGMTPYSYKKNFSGQSEADAKNYVPTRFSFQNPFVLKKLEEYSHPMGVIS